MFFVNAEIPEKWPDAPWVVSFKCVVKGYQDCRFDVKEGEDQSFKENKRAGARKAIQVFRIVNERGQLDQLTGGPSRGYDLYSAANDPRPEMIPRPQMIPKMDRK